MESCFFDLMKRQKALLDLSSGFGNILFEKTSIYGAVSFELAFGSFCRISSPCYCLMLVLCYTIFVSFCTFFLSR